MENYYELSRSEFGLRLAKLRESRGISARQMSLDIGQNKNYINAIETGNNYPNMRNFFSICEYLHVSPHRFFRYSATSEVVQEEFIEVTCDLPAEQRRHLYLIASDLRDAQEHIN